MPNITGCVPFFGLGQVKNLPPRGNSTYRAEHYWLRTLFRTPTSCRAPATCSGLEKSCVPFFGPVFRRT